VMGLTATEWTVLESAALPDPCDEETECGDFDDSQQAAETSLAVDHMVDTNTAERAGT